MIPKISTGHDPPRAPQLSYHTGVNKVSPSLSLSIFPSLSLSLSERFFLSLLSVRCSLFFRRQVRKSWRDQQRREFIVGYRHQIFYEFRGGFVLSPPTLAKGNEKISVLNFYRLTNFTPRSTRSLFLALRRIHLPRIFLNDFFVVIF